MGFTVLAAVTHNEIETDPSSVVLEGHPITVTIHSMTACDPDNVSRTALFLPFCRTEVNEKTTGPETFSPGNMRIRSTHASCRDYKAHSISGSEGSKPTPVVVDSSTTPSCALVLHVLGVYTC